MHRFQDHRPSLRGDLAFPVWGAVLLTSRRIWGADALRVPELSFESESEDVRVAGFGTTIFSTNSEALRSCLP